MGHFPPETSTATFARALYVRTFRSIRLTFALFFALLLATVIFALSPAQSALAQEPVLAIDKSIYRGLTTVQSGKPFAYIFAFKCASIDYDCNDATIQDKLPDGMEFLGIDLPRLPGNTIVSADFDPITRFVTIHFDPALQAGTSGFVTLNVRFTPGITPGTPATNSVIFSATGATTVSDAAPPITPTGVFEMTAQKRVVSNPAVQGEPIEFALELCSPDDVGGVALLNPVMVDTIPANATFLGAQGTENVDWTYNAATRRLTFINLPSPAPVGGCTTRTMTLSYPIGTTPIVGESNQLAITGTPDGCATTPRPAYCGGQGERTLNTSTTYGVVLPFPSLDVTKASAARSSFNGTEALAGEAVTYTIGASNNGFVNLSNVVVSDTIPLDFNLIDFSVDPQNGHDVSGYYRTSATGPWIALPDNPYSAPATISVAALGLGANTIDALQWELGPMAHPSLPWHSILHGTVKPGVAPNTVINNTAAGSATGPAPENVGVTDSAAAAVTVIEPRAIPRATKTSSASGTVRPGDTVTFTVHIRDEAMAHLPITNPVMSDLLPVNFIYKPGSLVVVSAPAGAPVAALEVIDAYGSTGRTLLRASFVTSSPKYQLQPGDDIVIRYAVTVADGTPPGLIENKATIGGVDFPALPACPVGERVIDVDDLDGDGSTTDFICQNPAGTGNNTVAVLLSLDSRKLVKGVFDSEYSDFGRTAPGSTADYQLEITNTSNVSITNIVVVDILPFIGDTGVIDPSARQSAWRPHLVGEVDVPPGMNLTVYYSKSSNPCRPELVNGGPAGCDPSWSTTLPLNPLSNEPDPTLVRAVKLDFCNAGTCESLERNEKLVVNWPMRAPVGAPISASCMESPTPGAACQIAWNSFGVTAQGAGLDFLPTEPKKVGIGVADIPENRYGVGDFVWLDVEGIQNDGIQQEIERGINGIRVELWQPGGTEPLATTYTADSHDINPADRKPGYYLFNDLPTGDYYIRFYKPDLLTASPANEGADDAKDSDATQDGASNYYKTAIFNLSGPSHVDTNWDFGMVRITEYGDAPYGMQTAWAGTTTDADSALAARHIVLGEGQTALKLGKLRDVEDDGQPTVQAHGDDMNPAGSDDEDGVKWPGVVKDVAGTGEYGVLVYGVANTVQITVTAPTTATGIVNAWIDWNQDNDWNDAGEQVAIDKSVGAGSGLISLSVTPPAGAKLGTTYARVRLSQEADLAPTGTAIDGEVEDYRIQVIEGPVKSIKATSEAHTTDAPSQLTIGEIIKYRLRVALPEGQLTNVQITDRLPAGLQYMANTISVTVESNVTMALANNPPTVTGGTGDGGDPIFTFGNVVNNDGDEGNEYVTLTFNALVINNSANQHARTLDNDFIVSYSGISNTSNAVRSTVLEPQLAIAKTVQTAPVDAGDPIAYKIVVTNNGSLTAFNAVISDTLDTNLIMQSVTVTPSPAGVVYVDNSVPANNRVSVSVAELKAGESVTLMVLANVIDNAATKLTIPNSAIATWTSLPGDNGTPANPTGSNPPGAPGATEGERTGSGTAPNDYKVTSSASAPLQGAPKVDKQLVGKATYTIGEEVVYDILVTLPEGITKDVIVTDILPSGLGFVNATVLTNDADSDLLTANFSGLLPTPTRVTTAGDGNDITWTFGNITVPGTASPGNSSFVIRMTTVVRNILTNQLTVVLPNSATLTYTNPNTNLPATVTDPVVNITLVEPILQVIKSVIAPTGADAGDTITYTVVLKHATNSVGTAWGAILTDTIPANLIDLDLKSVTATGMSVPTASLTGHDLRVPGTSGTIDVPQGAIITIVVTAKLPDTILPGSSFTNVADTTWSSLDGTPAEERHAGNGKLDAGGLNDYEVTGSVPFTVANNAAVTKALDSTNAPHTTGANVTIGEIVTYRILVTLGEGTIPSLTITDTVAPGMAYVIGSLVVDSTGFNGTLPTPTVVSTGNPGAPVSITYGSITVPGDNNPVNNAFTVKLQLRVLDKATNVGVGTQTVIPNSAKWTTGGTQNTTNTVNVTVVEPKMSIVKTITEDVAAANDVVNVTLVVRNIGTSTAFTPELSDTLPVSMTFDGGLTTTSGLAPTLLEESGGKITAAWDLFEVTDSTTIVFRAKLIPGVRLGQIVTNKAIVSEATTLLNIVLGERTEPAVESSDSVRVIAPDMRIRKDDGQTAVVGGQLLVYTITITNTGERAADGVVITETVPANTSFVAASSSIGWLQQGTALACAAGAPAGTICTFAAGTMAPNATRTVTFAVRVDSNIPRTVTTIANTATTGDDGTHGVDPTPANNTSTDVDNHVSAGLGDYVWLDANGNGIQDSGEAAVPNVTVKLLDKDGVLIATTTTSATGYYSFENLVPGDYIVEFVAPADKQFTLRDKGSGATADASDSDADRTTGRSPLVSLEAREFDPTIDAGLYTPASLGDYVWLDANVNGIQDSGEVAVPGATVTLFNIVDGAPTQVGTAVTDVNGKYAFSNLIPGDYYIVVAPPAGYRITPAQNTPGGADADTKDSDVSPLTGQSGTITLVSGQNDPTWDAGLFQAARLGDFVWQDMDYDGTQDAGEPFIDGVVVNLFKSTDLTTPISTTTTAGGGKYLFDNLIPGDYVVKFVKDPQFKGTQQNVGDDAKDSDADPVSGLTPTVSLANNETNLTVDAGFYIPASLGDRVWTDTNGNGIQDSGEIGVPGMTVELYVVGAPSPLKSTTTDVDGLYLFSDLLPGDYEVKFVPTGSQTFTLANVSGTDATDSDADLTTGRTGSINLVSGEDDRTWDAGIYIPASLGDYVWLDANVNGVQDGGESPVANVTVNLYRTGETAPFASTTTDTTGKYGFANLIPGSYFIEVITPAGYRITPAQNTPGGANADTLDSDVSPTTGRSGAIVLVSGQNDPTWDAGLFQPARLGDFVFEDQNGNGVQNSGDAPIAGVTVNLYRPGGTTPISTTTTALDGSYHFDNLIPGDYVVEFIANIPGKPYALVPPNMGTDDALDSDADPAQGNKVTVNLSNNESDQTIDAGFYIPVNLGDRVWEDLNHNGIQEAGEPGVTGMTVELYVAGATTPVASTTTGANGIYAFNNLLPGTYTVRFVATGEQKFTYPNVGADEADSDADTTMGRTGEIVLLSGVDQWTWDAGIYIPARLGDYVWTDNNANGKQDAGDTALAGVDVELYRYTNNTPTLIRTTTTDAAGLYLFDNLDPGTYEVKFITKGSQLLTVPNAGSTDADDSDADRTTGLTGQIPLISGDDDRTWDAGIYSLAAVGDRVWHDTNGNGIQDAGESGVPGVLVRLANLATMEISEQTTGVDGIYNFTGLTPGNYRIEVIPPAGYSFTQPNAGSDINVNSKVEPTTGRMVDFALASGENNLTKDAGIYRPAITIKKYTNGEDADSAPGPSISLNSPVIWTYNITNTGTVVLENLSLLDNMLQGPVTCPVTSLLPNATTTCTANGTVTQLGQYANVGTVTAAPPNNPSQSVSANDPSHYMGVARAISFAAITACRADGAFVDVKVDGLNFDPLSPTPLTLTWKTLTGDVVATIPNLPLVVNNVIWPGTIVDGATAPYLGGAAGSVPAGTTVSGWPGWTQDPVSGVWSEVPTNLRPTLALFASVNPELEVQLTYPDATPRCWAGPRSSLGDRVWNDTNANGIQDAGETGVDAVTVKLYRIGTDNQLELVAETVTAGGGLYLFPNLTPDDYVVEFIAPPAATLSMQGVGDDRTTDSDANPTDGRTAVIALGAGEDNREIDAGIFAPNLAIKKYTNGEDADLETGPAILINTPVTWTYFITNTGSVNLTNISLVDDKFGPVTCPAVSLAPNASMKCAAIGLAALGQYGNVGTVTAYVPFTELPLQKSDPSHYIGYDTLPVIVVEKTVDQPQLQWPGGPVVFTVRITNTSINDIVTLNTLVDSVYGDLAGQGTCSMPQTLPINGVYTCTFPATVLIPEDHAGDLTEIDVVTARGTGTNGEPVTDDDDASVSVPCMNGGTITGLVWHDVNGDKVIDQAELPFMLDSTLPAGQRIEVAVTAEDNDPTQPVADRTTVVVTQNGRFTMTGMRLNTTYTLRVADEPLQAMGYLPTGSSITSNVKTHTCAPATIDSGYRKSIVGLVGDFHWYDVNRDGKQNEWQDSNGDGRINLSVGQFSLRDMEFVDLNGNGLADIEGELLKCGINSTGMDASGTSTGPAVHLITTGNAANLASIVGSTGYYRFTYDGTGADLSATGSYTVTRDAQDVKTLESARDYAKRGSCQPIASAINKSIVTGAIAAAAGAAFDNPETVEAAVAPIPGPTVCGETTANQADTNLTDKIDHTDLTLDFAIVCVGADQLAGLGDRVWLDNNRDGIQNVGEPGIAGVTVRLYVNGDFKSPVRTTVTDALGKYSFDGLIPTSYVVEFVLAPDQAFTKWEVGNDYSISSDADPVSGRTPTVTLAPGQYDPNWDAGIQGDPTPDDPTEEPPFEHPLYMYLPTITK